MNDSKRLKVLFIGDISARPGRHAVREILPGLRKEQGIDFVVANAENAAGGKGVTKEILNELQGYGIDYFTAGEHVWDIKEFRSEIDDPQIPLVRAYNYEGGDQVPGKGWDIIDLGSAGKLIVACFMGNVFMRERIGSPFWAFDNFLQELKEKFGNELDNIPIVIDFHAEATAEKRIFGWYARNHAAAVLGTHTHVATTDAQLLDRDIEEEKCAYVTDTGMCGPKIASLWVDFDIALHNSKFPTKESFKVASGNSKIFNSVLIDIEKNFARKIQRIDKEIA